MINDEWQQCFWTDFIAQVNHGSGKDDFSGSDGAGFDDSNEDNFSLLLVESGKVQMPIVHPEGQPSYHKNLIIRTTRL